MGTLDAVQQEQLRAIGTYLSQVRAEQARTLEEISAKTYIPLRLLKAIEAGQEQPLPEPVFVQGFIRRYADALGLDGVDLSHRFPVHITPLPVMTSVATGRERENGRDSTGAAYATPVLEEATPERRSGQSGRSWLPYWIAGGLLALGGVALLLVRGLSSRPPTVPQQPAVVLPSQPVQTAQSPARSPSPVRPSPASPQAVTPASPSPSPSPSPVRSPAASNAPVSAAVNLTDASWIQVIVDGQVRLEETMPKGTRQTWTGQREIVIFSGNAGAVSVAANGEAAKAMGAPGEVKELTVKPRAQ